MKILGLFFKFKPETPEQIADRKFYKKIQRDLEAEVKRVERGLRKAFAPERVAVHPKK